MALDLLTYPPRARRQPRHAQRPTSGQPLGYRRQGQRGSGSGCGTGSARVNCSNVTADRSAWSRANLSASPSVANSRRSPAFSASTAAVRSESAAVSVPGHRLTLQPASDMAARSPSRRLACQRVGDASAPTYSRLTRAPPQTTEVWARLTLPSACDAYAHRWMDDCREDGGGSPACAGIDPAECGGAAPLDPVKWRHFRTG